MLRISLRYLRSKSSHSVVNLISRVSLFAIATPVAAVIILLSVFNGFGDIVEQMASSVDAPLTVESRSGRIFSVESLDTAALRRVDGVGAISLGLEQIVMVKHGSNERVMTLRGVEPSYGDVTPLEQSVVLGDSRTQFWDYDRLLIGRSAAYEMGIKSVNGSEVTIYSMRRNGVTSILPISSYRAMDIDVTGLFSLDFESESRYAITSLRFAQELFSAPGAASQLFIAPSQGREVKDIRGEIEAAVGEDFTVKDRYELNPTLYSIVKGEKRAIMLIAILVMVLASFTLIGALVMQIIDKRGEFTSLRAMGASMGYIRNIFIGCGVALSMAATLLGGVVGVAMSLLQQWYGVIKIPYNNLVIDSYPVRVDSLDVVMVVVASLIISALLSVMVVRLSIKGEF